MCTGVHKSVDEDAYKWFCQQNKSGIHVRGVEIMDAAAVLAKDLGVTDLRFLRDGSCSLDVIIRFVVTCLW